MIVMVFEYELADDPDVVAAYGTASAALRARLPDGVEIERFTSATTPVRHLALGTFADEDAVARWRRDPVHREAQRRGRDGWFTGYRLRMAEVVRDYGPRDRDGAPADALTGPGATASPTDGSQLGDDRTCTEA